MEPTDNRHGGDLWRITGADFIVRLAYQMGKTPLLPLFAAALGAGELLVGTIVSVSTATGMALKPLFGLLSDRQGRRLWLLIGLTVFSVVPFLYRFVETPDHLFALRLFHGLATAIFGPVGLAYVAEMGAQNRAERLGIFGLARSGAYLLAPTLSALSMTYFAPEQVFTVIGFASLLAFLPLSRLKDRPNLDKAPVRASLSRSFAAILASRAFRLVALLEFTLYLGTYALKAFLPLYAIKLLGIDLLLVGLFFTVQEAAHLVLRTHCGRFADRVGFIPPIAIGLTLVGGAMFLVMWAAGAGTLLLAAIMIGAGLALILPATTALYGAELPETSLGAGLGALGSLRNLGKIIGPVVAGAILSISNYQTLFALSGSTLLVVALIMIVGIRPRRARQGAV